MFPNLNKPTFGASASATSFGLGATAANTAGPWGNGGSALFGKNSSTTFGSQPSSTFGSPAASSTSIFPSFFPQTNPSGFGAAPPNQSTFGSNIFGQQQQQQPTTSNLFGSNTFGQQKPTGFGFGAQNPQPNLFGQSAQPQSSLFQPSGSNNLFGSNNAFGSSNTGTGTTIKFNPVTGTDTMQKTGVTTSINTKHHCITCMKEYEGKSLEELRFEDYQANRKGVQSQFGSTPFGSTPSMFGQTTESKPTFGQSTGFGQIGGTTFGQQNQSFGLNVPSTSSMNIFAKPPAFGTTGSTTAGFGGFNNSSSVSNAFGTNQNKPFGTTTATPLFGATPVQQATPFGNNLFGQTNQNTTGSFFNKPAQTTGFSTGGFGFNQSPAATTTTNLFQQSKPVFGLGQTASTVAFAQSTGFGQTNPQNSFGASTFGKTLTFGQNQTPFQTGQTSLFTNTQQKPGSILGGTGGGLFGTNTFGSNTSTMFGPQMSTQIGLSLDASQESKNLPLIASNQFGHSPFLSGLLPVDKNVSPTLYATNPVEIKKMLENNKKIDDTSCKTRLKLQLGPPKTQRDKLFEEVNDEDINKFYKTSCKRLILKKRPEESKQSIFDTDSIYNDLSTIDSSLKDVSDTSLEIKYFNRNFGVNNSQDAFDNTVATIGIQKDLVEPPQKINASDTVSSMVLDSSSMEDTNLEIKYFKKSFGKPSWIERKHISESVTTSFNDSQDALDNSLVRIDIPKGVGEPFKKINFDQIPSASDSSINKDLSVRGSYEVIEEESVDSARPTLKEIGLSGIILNRPEYYTLPTIEELNRLVNEDGRCLVEGFTIGRKGYGNVHFPDSLDVRNLNLDEIVHFRYREIHMYPDESKKPPIGEGLNRRAQVTLDKVYPRVKETKEIINDVEQLLATKFPEKMVEISSKHGVKFVDYRPETGSWVFMVDHFSKYGFTGSDETDCELSVSKSGEKSTVERTPKSQNLSKYSLFTETNRNIKLKEVGSDHDTMDTDLASEYTDEGEHGQGDVLHKSMTIELEQNEDDFISPNYEPSDHDLFYHSSQIQMMKATFFSDSECASTVSSMDYLVGTYKPDLLNIRKKVHQRRPPHRPKVWKVFINIASRTDDNILLSASRCYSDLGVFNSKCYKVGWSKGFRNYILQFPNEPEFDCPMYLSLSTIADVNHSGIFKKSIIECIKLSRECSYFILAGKEKIPTFRISKDKSYLMDCQKIFRKTSFEFHGKTEFLYHDVWSLCSALWGPGRKSSPFVKRRLISWLKASVKDELPDSIELSDQTIDGKLNAIFNLLTCFNVKEAAEIAMKSDMPTLAMIISQINMSRKLRAQMNILLEHWFNNMSVDHISPEMMKIYILLSGNPMKRNIDICEGLSWKRCFGVHLWYAISEGSPLQLAIDGYTKDFSHSRYVAEPKPLYEAECETASYDILYHVLQLYKNPSYQLAKALNPETYTSVRTDYQLSWLLLLFFKSIHVGLVDKNEEVHLHTSFSAQLEERGLWDLAILPLLYLTDNSLKKNLVMGILNRNMLIEDNERMRNIEVELVENFHVPYSWIEVVKADYGK